MEYKDNSVSVGWDRFEEMARQVHNVSGAVILRESLKGEIKELRRDSVHGFYEFRAFLSGQGTPISSSFEYSVDFDDSDFSVDERLDDIVKTVAKNAEGRK